MKIRLSCFLFMLTMACGAWAQTTRTWNGSVSADWFDPNNWTPTGVPAGNDTINFTNGTINLSAPVTIAGQFNWTGGSLSGSPITIAPTGTLTASGSNQKYLQNVLTNSGTVTLSGGAFYVMNNGTPTYTGNIQNLPGALFDIGGDLSLANYYGSTTTGFRNSGTLRKSVTSGTATFSLIITNAGAVLAQQGTLDFRGGGVIESNFTASAGAAIHFDAGAFTYTVPPVVTGTGAVQFTGGTLTLLNDTIPNLQLVGGTLTLSPAFQGGSITNLSCNSLLSGNYTVTGTLISGGGVNGNLSLTGSSVSTWNSGTITGTVALASGAVLNWNGGQASAPVSVANGASLVIGSATTKYLFNVLTNAGTVTWTNGTVYVGNNGTPTYLGGIENQAAGLFDMAGDQSLGNYNGNTNAYFHNLGTLRKSAATGTSTVAIWLLNAGSVLAQQGTINFQNGGVIEGSFTAAAGAAIHFSSGNFSYGVPPVINGPGAVQFTGGTLTLLNDVIPNLQLTGGTLTLGPSFQGGSITNLTCTSLLSGDYTVSGVLNFSGGINGNLTIAGGAAATWNGGTVTGNINVANGSGLNWNAGTASGPVNIASGANAVLGSGNTKYLLDVLTNAGTLTWTNGTIYVGNNGTPSYTGAIENQAGALFDIVGDDSLASYFGNTNAYFDNLGTLRKSAASGSTTVGIRLYNAGSVLAQQGTLNFQGGTVLESSFSASAGASIVFSGGQWSYNTVPILTGPGNIQFTGGTLALLNNTIPNLQLVGGTFTLGPAFQGGSISNLNCGGTLNGSYTVSGVLTVGAGVNGGLNILSNAVVNWTGGNMTGALGLTNGSTLNWSGGTLQSPLNIVAGASVNFNGGTANAPISVASGGALLIGSPTTKYLFDVLTNAGSVTWSNGTIYVGNNSTPSYAGAIENQSSGLFDIFCDASFGNYFGNTNPYVHNSGTLRKSAASGSTTVGIRLLNDGLVQVQQGTMSLQGGGIMEGSFMAASPGTLVFASGPWSYSSPPTIAGPGTIEMSGGTLTLLNDAIPNLDLVGGTFTLSPAFQGGTISNLDCGGTLNGTYTVSGSLNLGGGANGGLNILSNGIVNWSGGIITGAITVTNGSTLTWSAGTLSGPLNVVPGAVVSFNGGNANGPLNVANGASLLLGGTATKYLFNALTNAGTVTWTNGTIYVGNNGTPSYTGAIENLAGALWEIRCDQTVANYFGNANPYFHNLGVVQKISATGTSSIGILFQNAGALNFFNGIINFSGSTTYAPTGPALGYAISAAGQPAPLVIGGPLSLDGNLSVSLANGYTPGLGDSIPLITCTTRTNTFNTLNLPPAGNNLEWRIAYAASSVSLQVITNSGTTSQISGFVRDGASNPVTNITVIAFTTNANNSVFLSTATDSSGHYALNVTNGVWRVTLQGLAGRGYNEVQPQDLTINNGNQSANFVVQPYTGQSYNITVTANPGAGGSATGGGTFLPGSVVTLTATPNTASLPYSFGSWTENGILQSGGNPYVFLAQRNRQLTANFVLPIFTVSVSNSPPSAGTVGGAGSFAYGSTNVLTAQPNFGYRFSRWTEGATVLGTDPVLTTVIYTNHVIVANYAESNTNHVVVTATQPAGLALVNGAGVYTNGQSGTFTTPQTVVSGQSNYFFQNFVLTNTVISTSNSFTKVFSTTDPTNLQYTAVYVSLGLTPAVTNVSANLPNPVPATTNFQLAFTFDRTMDTNFLAQVTVSNIAPGAVQPVVPSGGRWGTVARSNDTFYLSAITFSNGMDGTLRVDISGARDPFGATLGRTNVYTVLLDATPPVLSNIAAAPSVLSAFITWNSDEPSSSSVDYGITAAYGSSTALSGSLLQAHGITINSLSPVTTYHFRVHSRDQAGNETISGDNSFTTFAAPDLQVTNLSVTGNLVSGGQLTIAWSDTNSGSGATFTAWYDRVIVTNSTTGQSLLNSTLYYDSNLNGNIAAGGSRNRQLNFTLPNGPSGAGQLRVLVTANVYANQYEFNASGSAQTNNTATTTVTAILSLYPDLQVAGLTVTNSQLKSGNVMGIAWIDSNTGNGSVSNSYQDRITVVNQTTAQTLLNTVLIQDAAANPIGAGQSLGRQYAFALPDGTAGAGNLQISVAADAANNVFEYNAGGTAELNNTSLVAVASTLAAYPDLVVTNIIVPDHANAGASIAVIWTDMNQGTGGATNTWYDQVFVNNANAIQGAQFLGSFLVTNSLAAGQSLAITQSVTLPQLAQGNRWLVVKANASSSFYELNATNNSAISTQAVTVVPTLQWTISSSSISEGAGTNSVSGTLTRNGDISAALPVNLSTTTGTNLVIPPTVTIPAGQSSVSFAFGPVDYFVSGPSQTETITATAAGFTAVSTSLTILENDPTTLSLNLSATTVNENAGTNALQGTITRNANFGSALTVSLISDNPGALLVPASVTIPAGQASATFGLTPLAIAGLNDTRRAIISANASGFSSASVQVAVLNVDTVQLALSLLSATVNKGAGNSADSGTITIATPLSAPQNVQLTVQGTTLLTIPATVSIPAGSTSVNFSVSVTNDNLVTGTQTATILARALTPGWTPVTNGQASATLQVLDVNGPSLALYPANSTISKGSNTLVTITRNTPPTNSLTVTLGSSPAGILTVPPSVSLPLNQTSATFTVTGILDGQQTGPRAVSVTAAVAGFNSAAAPMTVSDIYLPDLVPTSVQAPTNGLTSSQMTISWVVANRGLGQANQTWRDYVYLGGDSLGQNVLFVGLATNTSALPIGASYTNQATFSTPGLPGNFWLVIVADGGNAVSELNKQNNTLIWSQPMIISPVYRAEVTSVTPALAPAGTPIVISGRTFNPTNNQAFPNKLATVRIAKDGTRRVYTVVSDNSGNFTYTFQPLAREAGNYSVSADYPYLATDTPQGSFVLLGMQAVPDSVSQVLLPNVPLAGQILLSNLSDHPLSGLSVTIPDLQSNLNAQFTFTNTTLPGNGVVGVNYTFQSPLTRNAQIRFTATVTSSEGANISVPITANVIPLVPILVANPGYLTSGMLVGQQTIVSFDIINTGGASSGDLTVSLPDNLAWISLGSAATIPSIPSGGRTTVTLLLNPPPDLPLSLYAGNLAAFNGSVGVSVPFQFRAVSTATGDLQVRATDDYTYYVAGGPGVTNATIILRDPYTTAIIAQTNTDAAGIAYFAAVPAGPYTVDASATKHNQFRGAVTITPGALAQLEAFMPRQLVTYQWSVVPTEIPDNYRIVLESVFETEVPVPNVVIEEPRVMIPVAAGSVSQFTIKMSNHGLIAANGVHVNVPNDPRYLITPLVTDVGIIPAQSSVEVPVTVQLRTTGAKADGCNLSDLNACLPNIPLGVVYYYVCGPNNVLQERSIDLSVICTANSTMNCLNGLRDTISPTDNLLSLGCNALNALLACAGADLSPCQQAAISTACGAAVGFLEGGPLGAAAGGASAGAGDLLQCLCTLLDGVSLPSLPSSPPSGSGFGLGWGWGGGGGTWVAAGGGVSTGSSVGNCSGSGKDANLSSVGGPTALPKFLSQLHVPTKGLGVCARVRIRIEQSVTLTRTAFRGTLEMDNGGDASLTGIQVSLDFRDATNGMAASRFAVEGPVVSGLTAVDGTGTLAGEASGSAVYTFIPTLDAAPNAPATYQIGGTLSYIDSGETVTVPLLSAPITVYPEARLDLVYFQQRDVYADDPFTPEIEPSEPFYLGLIAKNVGAGSAHNFQITSGQPQIVDNQKGLLVNFSIIGTEVGDQPLTPSLSANLGDIPPGSSKEVTWAMLSTLQGRFISFNANFEHVTDLGSTNTSLINSVEIHEMIHPVLANRQTDDDIPDFLVNDIPDPANLPDILYLSDGSTAAVTSITNGTFDGSVSAGHLQIHLQAAATTGWNYFQLPDPGPGYLLDHVIRSDSKVLPLTNNAWTTSRTFPSSITGAINENLLHLFDWAGTGSYTIYYRSTNTTPPQVLAVGPVTPFNQSGAVSSVTVTFSELIDTNTFSYTNLTLTRNNGANLITSASGLSLSFVSNMTYSINGLAGYTALDGNYQLTVNGLGIYDLWGNNAGPVSASTQWSKGNAPVVVQSLSAVTPNPRNFPLNNVLVTFSKAINVSTFTASALSLTLNGGPNLINGSVTITPQGGNVFSIDGLGQLTGTEGLYVLTLNAAVIQDSGGTPGFGTQTATWSMITTAPRVAALEQVTTNPRNIVVRTLNVTFSEPIDPASFDYHDLTLTRDGGPNLITSDVTVTRLDPATFQVGNISWVQGYAGNYLFTINAGGITDLAGNAGTGTTNRSWQIILEVPPSPTNLVAVPDLGISAHDGLTSTNQVTLFGTVEASNLVVRITDVTTANDLGSAVVVGTNFSAALSFTSEGLHHLQFVAVDIAGNVSPSTFFNLFIDVVPPTAVFQPVPNPDFQTVSNLVVTFSEAVNTNTLSAGNFVLTFNGSNAISPPLVYQSSNTFLLNNLAAYTAPLGTYQITLQMNGIQDLAGNQSTNTITMSWVHATTNLAPVLAPIPDLVAAPDRLVGYHVKATDANNDTLTYTLAAGAPAGAILDPASGTFLWIPSRAYARTTNSFTVIVADNGQPSMSATQSFKVIVLDYLEVTLGSTNLQSGQAASLPVYLASNDGATNVSFSIHAPQDVLTNWTLTPLAPQLASATLQDQGTNLLITLNTAPGQFLQGTQLVSRLNFVATSNHLSGLINIPVENISARKPVGDAYSNYVAHAGTVVVVQDQAFLVALLSKNLTRSLEAFGQMGASYQLQFSTNLSLPAWQPVLNYVQTDGVIVLPLTTTNAPIFYRLQQQ